MSKKKICLIGSICIILLIALVLFFNRGIHLKVGETKDVSSIVKGNNYTIDGNCLLNYNNTIVGVDKGICYLIVGKKKIKVSVSEGESEEIILTVGESLNLLENMKIKDFITFDNSYISYSGGVVTALQAGNVKALMISDDDDIFVLDIIVNDVNTSNAGVMEREELTDDMKSVLKNMGNGYAIGGIWDGNNVLSNKDFYNDSNTLREYFKYIKNSGFDSVRVPISVINHMDSNYKIESSWLDTINYVVDAAIEAKLYIIIGLSTTNSNNENYCLSDSSKCYISADSSAYDESKKYLVTVWTQIANKLKDKNNKLLFEGFESIIDTKEKDVHNPICNLNNENDSCGIVNKLNTDFVDAVRNTGGNNSLRFLVCSTYDASFNVSSVTGVGPAKAFVIPNKDESVIMGFKTLGSNNITAKYFKENFSDKKIPILVSAYGNKDNKNNVADRVFELVEFNNKFTVNSVPNFLWDNGKDMRVMVDISKANSSNDKKLAWDYNSVIVELLNTKMEIQ